MVLLASLFYVACEHLRNSCEVYLGLQCKELQDKKICMISSGHVTARWALNFVCFMIWFTVPDLNLAAIAVMWHWCVWKQFICFWRVWFHDLQSFFRLQTRRFKVGWTNLPLLYKQNWKNRKMPTVRHDSCLQSILSPRNITFLLIQKLLLSSPEKNPCQTYNLCNKTPWFSSCCI